MISASILNSGILPSLRRTQWRAWLVALALVCTVGIYSIELTHDHKTMAAELACPVCHVMAHGAPNLLKPSLTPAVSIVGWYRHVLPRTDATGLRPAPALLPQPRAPPVSVPFQV